MFPACSGLYSSRSQPLRTAPARYRLSPVELTQILCDSPRQVSTPQWHPLVAAGAGLVVAAALKGRADRARRRTLAGGFHVRP